MVYSYRKASTGLSRAAFHAGYTPKKTPIMLATDTPMTTRMTDTDASSSPLLVRIGGLLCIAASVFFGNADLNPCLVHYAHNVLDLFGRLHGQNDKGQGQEHFG
jgi:hypothetical protein